MYVHWRISSACPHREMKSPSQSHLISMSSPCFFLSVLVPLLSWTVLLLPCTVDLVPSPCYSPCLALLLSSFLVALSLLPCCSPCASLSRCPFFVLCVCPSCPFLSVLLFSPLHVPPSFSSCCSLSVPYPPSLSSSLHLVSPSISLLFLPFVFFLLVYPTLCVAYALSLYPSLLTTSFSCRFCRLFPSLCFPSLPVCFSVPPHTLCPFMFLPSMFVLPLRVFTFVSKWLACPFLPFQPFPLASLLQWCAHPRRCCPCAVSPLVSSGAVGSGTMAYGTIRTHILKSDRSASLGGGLSQGVGRSFQS